jgi:hypothetical protein
MLRLPACCTIVRLHQASEVQSRSHTLPSRRRRGLPRRGGGRRSCPAEVSARRRMPAFRCLSLRRPRESAFTLARAHLSAVVVERKRHAKAEGDAGVAGYAPAITCGNAATLRQVQGKSGHDSLSACHGVAGLPAKTGAKCGQRISSHSPTALSRLNPPT